MLLCVQEKKCAIRPTCEPCRSTPTSTGSRAGWRPAASGPNDAIPPAELFALDQWHYHGTDAIRDAGAFLGFGRASRVLDIGAGIGGPARFLAHTTGCHVTALELQPELHRVGLDLTRRSGLAGSGDPPVRRRACCCLSPGGAFDAVISFLAILHVADRPGLCGKYPPRCVLAGDATSRISASRAPWAPR